MPVIKKRARRWSRAAWSLAAIAGAVAAVVLAWPTKPVLRLRAKVLLATGDDRSAVHLEPENADARRRLASIELKNGDWEVALLDLQQAEEFAPADPEAFVIGARILVDKGWLEAPEAKLDRAIEIAPGRTDARQMRAYIRARLGRYFGARQDAPLKDVPPKAAPRQQRLDGRDVSFRLEQWAGRLGDLRQQLETATREKSWNEAGHLVLEAAKLAPRTAFPPFMQGTLDLAHGDAAAAERDFKAALAEAPRSAVVAGALGRAWARQGGAAFAGDRLMQLAERDPGFAAVRYLAARAFVEAGDPLKAEGALRRGLELQPDSPLPYRHLTDYDFGLDRVPEALEICAEGTQRFPSDVGLRMMRAQIESRMGRHEEAIGTYQQLSNERPDLDLILYKLAGELPQGDPRFLSIIQKIGADEPVDAGQSDELGWLLYKAGQLDRARERLEVAVRDSPGNPEPHYHLAVLSNKKGDRARAKQELQLALGSGQPFAERLDALRLLRETSQP